jgi:ribonuclease HII
MLDYSIEHHYWYNGIELLAGVDEAGRGPLAGPVVAAAVIVPRESWIDGVDDSKKLSHAKREELFVIIQERALSIGVGIVSHQRIDEINILQATMQAMAEAAAQLIPRPQHLLVDGNRFQDQSLPFTTIIDGDAKCFSIAAASIIAKVTRDRIMLEYDRQFPQYGFAKHKGYGTKEHLDALRMYGPCEIHRRSFRMPSMVTAVNAE